MLSEGIRFAYGAVERQSCEKCDAKFDVSLIKLTKAGNNEFRGAYECVECAEPYNLLIEVKDDRVVCVVECVDGDRVRDNLISLGSLSQSGHSAESLVEGFHELHSSFSTLEDNANRLIHAISIIPNKFRERYGKSLYDVDEEVPTEDALIGIQKTSEWGFLHTELHNYLSSAYTYDQLLETVRPKVEWDNQVITEFDKYKTNSQIILGLRHYVQHEGPVPLHLRLNKGRANREVDILTKLTDVQVMDSQVDMYPPDGYKRGADHHYSGVENRYIDITQKIKEHFELSGFLNIQVGETALERRGREVREYEEHGEKNLKYENIEHRPNPEEGGKDDNSG